MCNLRAVCTPGPSPLQSPEGRSAPVWVQLRTEMCQISRLMQELWSKASHRHISDCHSTASKLTHSAASASDWAGQRVVCQHQHSNLSLVCSADLWSHILSWMQLIAFPYPICLSTSSHPCLVRVFSGIWSCTSYLHRILTPIFPRCLTKLMECSLLGWNTRALVGDPSKHGNWDFWDTCWKVPSESSMNRGHVSQQRPLKSLLALLWKVRHVSFCGSTATGNLCTAEWQRQSQEENLLHKLTGAERPALLIYSIPRQALEVTPSST